MSGPQPRNPFTAAFPQGLRELGYVYGEHFVTEPRGAESQPERLPDLAAELVHLQVDVIVGSAPTLAALKQATSTIPIVMNGSIDPVGQGYVCSLGHPGTNFTGLSLQSAETTGKRLELLKELVPAAALVAVLWHQSNRLGWEAAEAAGRKRGWKLLSVEIRDAREIDGAFKTAMAARAGALLMIASALLIRQPRQVADLAARSRLPAMYDSGPMSRLAG